MATLLVVDDEPNVLYSVRKGLQSDSLDVVTAATAREGIEAVRSQHPDVVILDVRLPDFSGLEAFDQIQQIDHRLPVIVITAHGDTETAIDAMKRGAFEYLLKPVDFRELKRVVARAVEVSRWRTVPAVFEPTDESSDVDRIVGNCAVMQEVYKTIGRVAPQDVSVLILGESGTGKELVARAIYHHSQRSEGPFLAINCAALPESLLETELFGHERGAFTGAEQLRIGKFEQCHQGTVFLDEIGDMTPATQAKVLRVLQDGRFERVGGNETIYTDVRTIAATNHDLETLVKSGRFRLDLFYRLNTFTILLPPLRERLEDLPLLVEYFIARLNQELGKQIHSVSSRAIQTLQSHSWPGNVRELESTIKYALVHAVGDTLTVDCLPKNMWPEVAAEPQSSTSETDALELVSYVRDLLTGEQSDLYRQVQQQVDRVVLLEVLRHVSGNQVQASELLGISRTTLRAKLTSLSFRENHHQPQDSAQFLDTE